jgi:hypothetical protein
VASPPSKVSDELASRARGLNAYVVRMETLFTARALGRPDLNRVYGGAFLSFNTYTERQLERLLLGLIMGRFRKTGVSALVDIKSEVVARKVVAGGRRYADWLPYEKETIPRALAFLSAGRPFTELETSDVKILDRLTIIRNALAHESSHALARFRKTFTESKNLPPDQLTPAGYLRGQHSPGVTRFTNTLNEAVTVFRNLCK